VPRHAGTEVVKVVNTSPAPREAIERAAAALARDASIEVTPAQVLEGPSLATLLPAASHVYLPSLPKADVADTLRACRQLLAVGLVPVPHVTPRTIGSRAAMRSRLEELAAAGVERLLLIAGDRDTPAGPYASTLDLLQSGLLLEHGFRRLGIAGHPEGHPALPPATLIDALAVKRDYAASTGSELWVVTQFVFTARHTVRWLERVRAVAGDLPVRIGIPGPARLSTLIAYAARCGVGASARMLVRRPSAARLLTCWTPDGLLHDLAYHRIAGSPFGGIHLFPFGGIARCGRWLQQHGTDTGGRATTDAAGAPPA